ncbi:MAG: C1 family peptidase [Solirubrobacteraceae bacterium]
MTVARGERRRGGGARRRSQLTAGVVAGIVATCIVPAVASADALSAASDGLGTTASQPYATGLVPNPQAAASPAAVATVAAAAASLPASADLTPYAMPVGDQGDVGSCAAWSTDYTALGYWENKEGISGGGLEPMYTYSQVTGGVDDGSSIEGNLTVDEQGVDNQSDYFQGNFDYSDMPTAAEKAHAVNWKLSSFSDLSIDPTPGATTTQQSIEVALAAGNPVVIGIPVYNNFFYVTSANNGYYSGPSGSFAGYHAITAMGYNSQGLVIENSWGPAWGNSGYATLSWSFVNSDVFDAVSVGQLVTGQPAGSTAPAVTGTARQGSTLTASTGSWAPAATTYAYQWQRAANGSGNWAAISGATAATYVPGAADLGNDLRVSVTATNAKGSGVTDSVSVGPVTSGAPAATTPPAVTGTLRVGQTLATTTGTWSPAATAYTYQWQRSTNSGGAWTNIAGATSASYVTAAADANADERVTVTATGAYGAGTSSSSMVGPVSDAPYNTAAPGLSGTQAAGQILTATTGTWSPAGTTYAYQWQRLISGTWASVSGMTSSTYMLEASDVGTSVRVQVAATNPNGTTYAWTASGTIASGVPVNTAAPSISGTLRQGETLTAATGTWNPAGTSYTYQWQHAASAAAGWSNISGATGATYALGTTDLSTDVRVQVTAVNQYGSATATSAATPAVASGAPVNGGAPTISGTAYQGQTLTAAAGTWNPAGTSTAYQWQHSTNGGVAWSNISGATAAGYTLAAADIATEVRVAVTSTNPYGTATATSAASATVASGAPADTIAPVISGSAARGSVLTVSAGTWNPAPTTTTYQWQRSSNSGVTWSNISGATASSYTAAVADENAKLRVQVTGVNAFGQATASTPATGSVAMSQPANAALPTISGTLKVASKLTATTGTWSGVGNTYSYQWQRYGTSWSNISGATSSTYTLASADSGDTIRVVVTATNPDATVGADSAATAKVTATTATMESSMAAIKASRRANARRAKARRANARRANTRRR